MGVALADDGGCGNRTRPTASFHSVEEEIGGAMGWRVGADEHSVDGTEGQGRGVAAVASGTYK